MEKKNIAGYITRGASLLQLYKLFGFILWRSSSAHTHIHIQYERVNKDYFYAYTLFLGSFMSYRCGQQLKRTALPPVSDICAHVQSAALLIVL